MNGSRTIPQIVELMSSGERPPVTAPQIMDTIESLFQAGHLEDANSLEPETLSPRERERYGRGHAYFRWVDTLPRKGSWDVQLRLRDARVVVVGVGGAGGAAAQGLAATGVGHLHCVDSDIVELSNLNRQVLYNEDDLGKPKVDVAVARLGRLNSDIKITGERSTVRGQADLEALAEDCDVLVLAADRPEIIRTWANRACLAKNVPWVGGGYHGALLTVGVFKPGDGACWECLKLAEARRPEMSIFRPEDESSFGTQTPGHPVTAASAGMAGLLMTHAAISLLTGVPALPAGRVYGMNLVALTDPVLVSHPRQPGCPACGTT
ncbi:HesA/MoeB/ThiF family protein [Actinoallomurus bryophytorum]|nr:ThiF family adenylyltransferase [Actinoallomurus bryophytorum]